MRRDKTNELPWYYDLGFLPEFRKMSLIAGHQVVRAGSIGTFQEDIVVGVACDFRTPNRSHGIAAVPNDLQQLLPRPLANPQLRPAQHFAVLFQDGAGHIEARRFG